MPEQDNEKLPEELLGKKGTNAVTGRMSIANELLTFLWQRKLYWMIPMIIVLLVFAAILVASSSSLIAPFVYPILG